MDRDQRLAGVTSEAARAGGPGPSCRKVTTARRLTMPTTMTTDSTMRAAT